MKSDKFLKELILELVENISTLNIEVNKLQNENREIEEINRKLQRELNFQNNTINIL
jgi:predicted ATP-grasp superfamily ATP-dependent carboligase